MKAERIKCKICGKKVSPSYEADDYRFSCPKCGALIPYTKQCQRRILAARIIYHLIAFGLILLGFYLLYTNQQTVAAIVFAAITAPLSGVLEKVVMSLLFFKPGRYEFEP